MIVTRAPFRITLGGGGTDLPSFYENHGGFLVTMAIDKYIYVMVNKMILDKGIQLNYKESEHVEDPKLLKHPFVREILLRFGIKGGIEMTSLADLPSRSGLGSSGSFAVASILALRTYMRQSATTYQIADEACDIEMNQLKHPVGKQDQFIAAFGGIISMDISKTGEVVIDRLKMEQGDMLDFMDSMRVYYTGIQRDAANILSTQNTAAKEEVHQNHNAVIDSLKKIKEIGYKTKEALESRNYDDFGKLMDIHWEMKKNLSSSISIEKVDKIYAEVKKDFGVLGGKIIGAGGGGFLLLYAPKKRRELDKYMAERNMPKLEFFIDHSGAKVVADLDDHYEFYNKE
jgi:D-glycero-alpha-D-manno-heptose-7-phosphate kinase